MEKYWNYILVVLAVLFIWWLLQDDTKEGFGATLTAKECRANYVGAYGGYVSLGGSRSVLESGKAKYNDNSCADIVGSSWDDERNRYGRFAIGKDAYFSEKLQTYLDAPQAEKQGLVGTILGQIGNDYSDYDEPTPPTVGCPTCDNNGAMISEEELMSLQSDLQSLSSSVEELLQSVNSAQSSITDIEAGAEEMQTMATQLGTLEEEVNALVSANASNANSLSETWKKGWFMETYAPQNFGGKMYLGSKKGVFYGVASIDHSTMTANNRFTINHTGGTAQIPYEDVGFRAMGVFKAPKSTKYAFRFFTDDGSKLYFTKVTDALLKNPTALTTQWTPVKVAKMTNANSLTQSYDQLKPTESAWHDQGSTAYITPVVEMEKDEMLLFRYDWYNNKGAIAFSLQYRDTVPISDDGELHHRKWKLMGDKVVTHSTLWNNIPLLGYD